MKKIGFVDYYISEWHANNYPAWIKNYCKSAGLDYEVTYAWAEKDVSLVDGKTTAEWCENMNIEQYICVEKFYTYIKRKNLMLLVMEKRILMN